MRIFGIIFLSLGVIFSAASQSLHTPEEILKILEKSPVKFVIDTIEGRFKKEDAPVLADGYVLQSAGMGDVLAQYQQSDSKKTKEYFKKGEKLYEKKKYKKARKCFQKALDETPDHSQMMVWIGKTYEAEDKKDNALKWYEKATQANAIDYQGFWNYGRILLEKDARPEAMQAITKAHLLNRNHPGVLKTFKKIYQKNNILYPFWTFDPMYKITKDEKNEIHVGYQKTPWLAYGLCKAAWEHEPSYKKNMDANLMRDPRMMEEKECLLSAVIAYESMEDEEKNRFPEIVALITASEKEMIDEFVIYEIWSRKNPLMLLQTDRDILNKIENYLLEVRCKRPGLSN